MKTTLTISIDLKTAEEFDSICKKESVRPSALAGLIIADYVRIKKVREAENNKKLEEILKA